MLTETFDLDITPVNLVSRIDHLISLPEVWFRIQEMLRDPHRNWHSIAEVISYDPGLTSRILQLVNSAYFGQRGRVERLSQAIGLIGEIELNNIVTVAAVIQGTSSLTNPLPNMEFFWMHSVRTAILSRHLARMNRILHPERLFVAGLLHDIGRLIIHQLYPALGRQLYHDVHTPSDVRLHEERRALGFDHGDLGAELARHWNLPVTLCDAIQFHHYPDQAIDRQMEASIVHIANGLVHVTEEDEAEDKEFDPDTLLPGHFSPRALELCPIDGEKMSSVVVETMVEAIVVHKAIVG